jgi:hypothetical protein
MTVFDNVIELNFNGTIKRIGKPELFNDIDEKVYYILICEMFLFIK